MLLKYILRRSADPAQTLVSGDMANDSVVVRLSDPSLANDMIVYQARGQKLIGQTPTASDVEVDQSQLQDPIYRVQWFYRGRVYDYRSLWSFALDLLGLHRLRNLRQAMYNRRIRYYDDQFGLLDSDRRAEAREAAAGAADAC